MSAIIRAWQKGETMAHKSKFNKVKCAKCKWHGTLNGKDNNNVHCYYVMSGQSCLYRDGNEIKDRRGEDYNHCLLYERGRTSGK